ncbi:MAG: helix-turn-helix domain-containing protein [Burkholderiaceae bacterium]
MRHAKIQFALKTLHRSFSDIARELGVTATSVASVSRREMRSARIESAIASAIGLGLDSVFPEWYAAGARRKAPKELHEMSPEQLLRAQETVRRMASEAA